MESGKRLILIDGHAILHRAYHALPPLTTRSGELVNAVYGFATMLLRIMSDLEPCYLAVAFDTPKPNFRHQEYVGYQAQRKRMDSELSGQIEKVHDLVRAFNIPIFEIEGYEADDVIGSLSRQAEEKGLETLIVTGDRDLMQLVTDKVKLFMPVRGLSEGQIVDRREVEEKLGIPPEKVIDYKALVGDSSDNYPGVPGIGPKTAVELLQEFKNLEGIYGHLSKIEKKSLVEKLAEGAESAALSKKLATILTDAPVSLKIDDCRAQDYDRQKVADFFKEMGFRSLVGRMEPQGPKEEELKEEDRQQNLF